MPKGFDPSDIIAILPEKYRNYIGFVVKRGSEAVKYCYLVLETVGPLPQPIFEMFCSSQLYIAAKSSKPGHMGGNEGVERIGDKIAIFRNIHTEYRDIRVIGAIVSVGEFPPFIIFTKQSNHDVLFKTAETIDHEYLSRLLATIWDSIENIVNLKEKADPFKSSTITEASSRPRLIFPPNDKEEAFQTSSLHPIERLSPVELGVQLLDMCDLLQYLRLSCSKKARDRFTSPFNADKKSDLERCSALIARTKYKSWEDQVSNKQSLGSICDKIEAVLKGEPFLLVPCFAPPPPVPPMPACLLVPKKARCAKVAHKIFNLQMDIREAVLKRLNALLEKQLFLLRADAEKASRQWKAVRYKYDKTSEARSYAEYVLTHIQESMEKTKNLKYSNVSDLSKQAYEIEGLMRKARDQFDTSFIKKINSHPDHFFDAVADFLEQPLRNVQDPDWHEKFALKFQQEQLPCIKSSTMNALMPLLPEENKGTGFIIIDKVPEHTGHPIPLRLQEICKEHFAELNGDMWQKTLAKYADTVLCVEGNVASKMAILKKVLSNWKEVYMQDVFGDIGRAIIELSTKPHPLWYNGKQLIEAFLDPLLAEVKDLKNFLDISCVFAGMTIGQILSLESNCLIFSAIKEAKTKKIIAMPTNVDYNHWAAVVFCFHDNVLHILHNDPLGKEIDQVFLKITDTQAGCAGCEYRIHDYKVKQQQDPYSTGAYTAESIYMMIQQLLSPRALDDLKGLDDILRKRLQNIGSLTPEAIQTLHTPKAKTMEKVSSTVKEVDSEEEIAAAVWQSLLTSLCLKNAQFQSLQAQGHLTKIFLTKL